MEYSIAKKDLEQIRSEIKENPTMFQNYHYLQELQAMKNLKKYGQSAITYVGNFLKEAVLVKEELIESIWVSVFNILSIENLKPSQRYNQPSLFDSLKKWINWSLSI
jgi:hypothetical protein